MLLPKTSGTRNVACGRRLWKIPSIEAAASEPTASIDVKCANRLSDSSVAASGAKKRSLSMLARLNARMLLKSSACMTNSALGYRPYQTCAT